MEPFVSFGGAVFKESRQKVIRLILQGCSNRPFFHVSVQEFVMDPYDPVIEQIGTYDPVPNVHNEKLLAINFERLEYWLKKGAKPTVSVLKLLGVAGYLPIHPSTFKNAFLNRKLIQTELEKLQITAAKISAESVNSNGENENFNKKSIDEKTSSTLIKDGISESDPGGKEDPNK